MAGMSHPLTVDQAERVVELAVRAPSLHNTQPWRFVLRGGALELHADRDRQLAATDPDGRQLVLSCGAALFGVRLALRAHGWVPHVQVAPDPDAPDLLARVAVGGARAAAAEDVLLCKALPRRQSQRRGLVAEHLPSGLLGAVRRAAGVESAVLLVLEAPDRRRAVADLVAAADRAQRATPEVLRELSRWTARPPESGDGVPPGSWAESPPPRSSGELVIRDFAARTLRGAPARPLTPAADRGETAPVAAALVTRGDTTTDWLRAGQALYRVLLQAASMGVQASLHSQPFGLLGLRALLREELSGGGEPQMLLQLGIPEQADAVAPLAPRRPVAEVLALKDLRLTAGPRLQ